jgi:MFS family permease
VRVTTRALRHRNFQLFLSGQFLGRIGIWVQSVAQSWLVYRLSDSAAMLGLVGFASQVPYLLLSPVAGSFADRTNRRRLIMIAQTLSMLQALLLAVLTLTGTVQVWHVFCLALALGVIGVFDMTGRQSFLVEMVGKDDLMNAIALNSTVYNAGRIIGPGIAGLLVAAIGEGYCFLLNGVLFLSVIASLMVMRLPPATPHEAVSPYEHFLEGWEFVRDHAPSRTLLLNLGIVSIMNYPFLVLLPVFADRILGGGPEALGLLMSSFGLGAILGAIYMASRTGLRGLSRTITRATIGYGVTLILFAFSPTLYLSCLFLVATGFGLMLQVSSTNTSLQTLTPDALRGRVMGFYGMMFLGMAPIGSLMAGWLGEWVGARYTVAFGAVVCIAAALVFDRKRPVVVAALRQISEEQATLAPIPAPIARSERNGR